MCCFCIASQNMYVPVEKGLKRFLRFPDRRLASGSCPLRDSSNHDMPRLEIRSLDSMRQGEIEILG